LLFIATSYRAYNRPMRIHALAAPARGAVLEPFDFEAPPLGHHDVLVRVSACGICRSDVHMIDDDWKRSRYPLVPGHEVVGVVEEAGAEVVHLRRGERVGVGWQRSACLACPECLRGLENLCHPLRRPHEPFAVGILAQLRQEPPDEILHARILHRRIGGFGRRAGRSRRALSRACQPCEGT
jgi:hypothetical protein